VGKTRIGRKEYNRVQEFKYEIQRLKKENDTLRKRLARIDLDEYGQLNKTIKKHQKQEKKQQPNDILEKLRQEWKCNETGCGGFLEIFLYNKLNDTWYFRKCNESGCKNRTKSKKYTPDVKGIIKKEEEE
jgi:hypothetical protein